MILTAKQEEGLRIAIDRYKDGEKYTVIGGYAGTGKSTLVRAIIEAMDIDEKEVCFACFTGKAAQVLQKKGNKNVLTLHKLLYDHIPLPEGGFLKTEKIKINYRVVIVDEVSMAPAFLMDVLFRHNVYVICLGDPFQLPPVDKDQDNHLLDHPHVFLDQIMRQEEDSEIIRLSMDIRNGKPITFSKGEQVMIIPKNEISTGMMKWADQILCGTNRTRIELNNQMRDLLGRGENPEHGDKIICLRNYWDCFDNDENPLVNGTIGYINTPFEENIKLPKYLGGQSFTGIHAGFVTDSDTNFQSLFMDRNMIMTGEYSLDWSTSYKMKKNKRYLNKIPKEFTYGYAITGHKSQGSEWDKVLIKEEDFPFNKTEHARWLYTCVTRASDKLILAR